MGGNSKENQGLLKSHHAAATVLDAAPGVICLSYQSPPTEDSKSWSVGLNKDKRYLFTFIQLFWGGAFIVIKSPFRAFVI